MKTYDQEIRSSKDIEAELECLPNPLHCLANLSVCFHYVDKKSPLFLTLNLCIESYLSVKYTFLLFFFFNAQSGEK